MLKFFTIQRDMIHRTFYCVCLSQHAPFFLLTYQNSFYLLRFILTLSYRPNYQTDDVYYDAKTVRK
jgi:hypothetical protein